ncbi:MAG TPA: hypothetical protein DDZ39_04820 [Flavobacteriaceae bacterium]|nr:hypothetical protein [Flavobacteriaceae bacterium]HBS13018.1 hypothetical protein [Flavobacteriaceae bacterium]
MIPYIIKASICLASFYLFYKLFLEKENIHTFKRIYLLLSILVSLSIPFITYTQYIESEIVLEANLTTSKKIESSETINQVKTSDSIIITQQKTDYLASILWAIYALGVFIFGIKFIINLVHLFKKIHENPKQKVQNFTHVLLQNLIAPHTFFNYLFLNKSKYETNQIPQEVLWHEQTHAQEKHSLDVLFIELLNVIFWFNPLFYYLKKSIKLNHEFLADRAVLNKGVSLTAYQEILLAFSSNPNEPQLANAINYSSIKKRLIIMKTNTSKKTIWLKNLVLLPLLTVLIYSFSNKTIVQKENQTNESIKNEIEKINKLEIHYLKTPPILNEESNSSSNQITIAENIIINIDENGKLLLNESSVKMENLANKLNNWLSFEQKKELVLAKIIVASKTQMGFITDVKMKLREYGTFETSIQYISSLQLQEKATPEQIAEYNTLAEHYNSQSKDKMIVKVKDMKRIKYLYDLMTHKQKNNAETFPNFPPPPAPIPVAKEGESPQMVVSKTFYNYKDENEKEVNVELVHDGLQLVPAIPPPPPIPANATELQKNNYKAAIQKYEEKKKHQIEEFNSSLDKNNGDLLPPPPPPLPPNPIDHLIEMAKKGANFYFNNKKISSDKAIDIAKNNEDINIYIKEHNSKKPIVKLSTKPIRN